MMSQGFKRGSRWRTNSPEYLFFYLIQNFQVATCSTSPDMKTVFHKWPYGRFLDIHSNLERKKFLRTNQGSNFSEGSFTNRDNVRAPIKFRRESQPQHLKRWFFLKDRPINFHINSKSITRPLKRNQTSFSSIETNKPLHAPVHSISQVRFTFRSQF